MKHEPICDFCTLHPETCRENNVQANKIRERKTLPDCLIAYALFRLRYGNRWDVMRIANSLAGQIGDDKLFIQKYEAAINTVADYPGRLPMAKDEADRLGMQLALETVGRGMSLAAFRLAVDNYASQAAFVLELARAA